MLRVTWRQALAWRMRRHYLEPVGDVSTVDVVKRLCGVQAQVASSAELAIRLRQRTSKAGDVGRAIAEGRLIKTWAMRGTLHLLAPEDAGDYLSMLASGRSWELPSWQRYFGMTPRHWERFRPAVREALAGGPMTREELTAAIVATPGLEHVGEELGSGWGTLLKPLAWQGDLVFGPSRGNRVTFMRPDAASRWWAEIPDPDESAPRVILAYLAAYAPGTPTNVRNWLARGRIAARQLRGWFEHLRDRVSRIEVDGEEAFVRAEDVDELESAKPTASVRLLAGFDQYVLGPGTADGHVLPAARRAAVSRQSGWIAPAVVAGGTISGTWQLDGEAARVSWFPEAGRVPKRALGSEVERLSSIVGRELRLVVEDRLSVP